MSVFNQQTLYYKLWRINSVFIKSLMLILTQYEFFSTADLINAVLNKINNIINFFAETSIRNDAEKITINLFKLWVKEQFYTVVLTLSLIHI